METAFELASDQRLSGRKGPAASLRNRRAVVYLRLEDEDMLNVELWYANATKAGMRSNVLKEMLYEMEEMAWNSDAKHTLDSFHFAFAMRFDPFSATIIA